MGLGEIFDGVVREFGRSEAGTLLRASDKSIDNLFRGPEARCRQRFQQSYAASQQSSSSNNAVGGLASLAILGGVALIGTLLNKSDNKTTNAK
ncbi:MAG: hypothetical protein IJG33_11030 [Selenomonadaceae bacterium]|nr:hypothetical protein [Selenomonadaceae bacterium]